MTVGGPVRIHAKGQNHDGRPDLVPTLKAMSMPELSAYCSRVLSQHAGVPLTPGHPLGTIEPLRPCPVCGDPIPPYAGHGPRRLRCSQRCTQRAYQRRRRLQRQLEVAA